MTRLRTILLLVVIVGVAASVSAPDDPPPPDVEALLEEADAAFAHGEEAARAARSNPVFDEAESGMSKAVAAWHEAGGLYRDAFRLLDPVLEQRRRRGLVAFRTARSYAKAAQVSTNAAAREYRADTALLWLAQVEHLTPEMERQVWYERAELRDGDIDGVRDPVRAHAAFTRYLELVGKLAAPPESERERIAHAQSRAEALAPPIADETK